MPKLKISSEVRKTAGAAATDYTLLRLDGFIDAPNFLEFDQTLEALVKSGNRYLVIDFRRVQYINSTGISAVIRVHSTLSSAGGSLFLVQVPRTVGLTMHLLGVTSIVPFLKSLNEAEQAIEKGPSPVNAEDADFLPGDEDSPKEIPVVAEIPMQGGGSVVLAVPRESAFSQIVERRMGPAEGEYRLAHSCEEVFKNLGHWDPDLIVLDHRLNGADDFLERLKVETHACLTSVIMLYEKGSQVDRRKGFRVWENDYLVDPFDLMQLFRLTEAELRRVPKDKKLFTQQVHFEFYSDRPSVDRGLDLANRLIHKLQLDENVTTALYAAFKEAVDNAVLHGNRHDPDKKVEVNFLVDPNKVTFIVEDDGAGFEYDYFLSRIDSKEAFEKAKQRIRAGGRGGLGILLMHKCADRLEYSGAGNVVRLEKNLKA